MWRITFYNACCVRVKFGCVRSSSFPRELKDCGWRRVFGFLVVPLSDMVWPGSEGTAPCLRTVTGATQAPGILVRKICSSVLLFEIFSLVLCYHPRASAWQS